ncbi:uncharacterized protein LOC131663253 isoform X2 [Phymastichus coffea]|uniref:uncharacterized protein LOC131663253 isoform X2 n=1 Tax=Phymastichus coffea TaxID=108790 RepID=UPI00273B6F4E|nr:uncharacterized protein LOC131663253 isoform X2 [Phymastichus coffea]
MLSMLNDDRITALILLVCAITRVHESIAELNANTKVNANNKESEKVRYNDSLEHWKGRWMPSRPGEYTVPPKVFHKKSKIVESSQKDENEDNSLEHWKGRWMPSRPGEYTAPPKVFHKKSKIVESSRNDVNEEDSLEHWEGRWMPSRPGEYTAPPKIFHKSNETESVATGSGSRRVNAGLNDTCDDGLNNVEADWNRVSRSHVCFGRKIVPDLGIVAEYYCETIPKNYRVMHRCMSEAIDYVEDIPTFGTSRPIWPAYGEYEYLPAQRWLRSLEGAIVMLYHPCANTLEVERLKSLVRRCLRRHVISPNDHLHEERPLALLSWGCKLSMSWVDENAAKRFIRENALRGPEDHFEDGNYIHQLIEKAGQVSGDEDRHLCP